MPYVELYEVVMEWGGGGGGGEGGGGAWTRHMALKLSPSFAMTNESAVSMLFSSF